MDDTIETVMEFYHKVSALLDGLSPIAQAHVVALMAVEIAANSLVEEPNGSKRALTLREVLEEVEHITQNCRVLTETTPPNTFKTSGSSESN